MRYIAFDEFTGLDPDQFRLTLDPEMKVMWGRITFTAHASVSDMFAKNIWWENSRHPEANTVYSSVFSQEFAFQRGVYKLTKYHTFVLPDLKVGELILSGNVLFKDGKIWGPTIYVSAEQEEVNEKMSRVYLQKNKRNERSESLEYSWGTLFTGENNYHDSRCKAVCLSLKRDVF